MTIDEFNSTAWRCGMTAKYHGDGRIYPIAATDFAEQLIGLQGLVQNATGDISWVRCENVTPIFAASGNPVEVQTWNGTGNRN